MYKGVGGWVGGGGVSGGGGWETGGGLYLPIGLFGVATVLVQEVLVIGPDKTGGPYKRCLTNTGVNIRPIPPI